MQSKIFLIVPQKNFFEKITNINFIYLLYWPLSFCKILKKFLEPIQSYEDVTFSGPNYPCLSWTKIFWYKPLLLLSWPIGPFHWVKFLKNSYSKSRVMKMHHSWAQNDLLAPNKFFWKKSLSIGPFCCAKFLKNSYSRSRVMRMHQFWA